MNRILSLTLLFLTGIFNHVSGQSLDSTWGITCYTNKFSPTFSFKSNIIDTCASSINVKVSYKGKPSYSYWSDGISSIDRSVGYSGNYKLYLFDSSNCADTSSTLKIKLKGGYISVTSGSGSNLVTICKGDFAYLYAYHNEEIVWNTGETTSNIVVSKPGKYFAKTKGSSVSCPTVSDTITVNVVSPKKLGVKVTGKTDFCLGDSCTLEINTPDSNIYWLPYYDYGKKITVKKPGIYSVYYKDPVYGCGTYSDSVYVNVKVPEIFSICMVTNDSSTGRNKIIWKSRSWVTKYIIYRETNVSGEFEVIGELKGASNEFFIDTTSKPRTRAYTYYVNAFDSCGNTSTDNQYYRHTTLHLTASLGVTGENNLNWSDYFGIYPINTYNIYRSNDNGPFKKIASVSSSVKAFSDYEPPKGVNRYKIGIDANTDCNGSNEELNSNTVAFGISLSSGNIETERTTLFPNPANLSFRIVGDNAKTIEIYSTSGYLIKKIKSSEGGDFSIEDLPSGLYIVKFGRGNIFKLIKE